MSAPWLQVPRRPRLEGTTWQGIRLLKLKLSPVHPAVPTSAELEIHLNLPTSALSAEAFRFGGGKALPLQPVSVQLPVAPDTVVRARFEAVGDYHPYSVELLSGGEHPLHPFFARAEYGFKIDCDRGDCEPAPERAPGAKGTPPAVDLLTRDYAGFVNLLADRVRVTHPDWADLSPASMERVLVELLAHHADLLAYYQDRVANEAFLEDATQRYSLQQHAVLLGHRLFEGTAARTELAVIAHGNGTLPRGLSVELPGAPRESEVTFHLPSDARVLAHHSRLPLAAWPGAHDAQLPAGGDRVLLWGHVRDLRTGQRLAFEQGASAQVVTLTAVRETEEAGWVASPDDAEHSALRAVTELTFTPPLERAYFPFFAGAGFSLYGNLAEAVHGARRVAHFLPTPTADVKPEDGVIPPDRHHAVWATQTFGGEGAQGRPLLRALRIPEAPLAFVPALDEHGEPVEVPLVERVRIDQEDWFRREHLHASQPFDRHYVLTSEEDGTAWLHFGDGVRGRAVPWTSDAAPVDRKHVEIVYRVGAPSSGNVAPHQLTGLLPHPDAQKRAEVQALAVQSIFNVVASERGRPRESLEAARLSIPSSLKHDRARRAVAPSDYARAALEVEGVARAAVRVVGGLFNTIVVLVDPKGQGELTEALRARVHAHLDRLRMAGREHVVAAPEYVPIELVLAICVEPGALPTAVRAAVEAALRPGTAQRPGFFHPDRLSFGQDLELGEILAHAQAVPGVRSAKALVFRRLRDPVGTVAPGRIALGVREVARLDADENLPGNGRLQVQVVGIEPGLDEDDFRVEDAA